MSGLTFQQRACLSAIERLTVDGVSPSYGQIAEALGLTSKSSTHRLVHSLAERGRLRLLPNQARSIEIVREDQPKFDAAHLRALTDAELREIGTTCLSILRERAGLR